MDVDVIYRLANFALFIGACGYGLWRGGFVERAVATTCVLGGFASWLAIDLSPARWHGSEVGLSAIDALMLCAFLALLQRSTAKWLQWICALQLITVTIHVARLWKPEAIPVGYMFAAQFLSVPILILLIVAAQRHHRKASASLS